MVNSVEEKTVQREIAPAHPLLTIMSSKSHIYFQNLKKQAQEKADHMATLHKLFGFDCYIPNAPVTRSHGISDFSISKGIGPELKKVKKPKKASNQPVNYRKKVTELLSTASDPLSSVRVASMLGIAKSTAQAHLFALYEEGFLKRYSIEATSTRPLTYLYSKK